MATPSPSLFACASGMTAGERRLAELLEQKLDDDYLLCYNVPVGPKRSYPYCVFLHPRRGRVILETKDRKLETIHRTTLQLFEIRPHGRSKTVI